MNQQPNQQQPNQQRSISLQPAHVQRLVHQCSHELQEAKNLGTETPAGQEHLRKAQRIRQILLQYQQEQQSRQNSQQGPQAHSVNQTAQSSPQTGQQQIPSRPISQQQQQPQPQQQQQQSQVQSKSQGQAQQGVPQNVVGNPNPNITSRVDTSSPVPISQTAAIPSTAPNNQQRNPFQQLQYIKQIIGGFQENLKAIEEAKKSSLLPQESLARLLQKEQSLKERFEMYKNAAFSISQHLQRQQQQQQNFQQQRSQSQLNSPQVPADISLQQINTNATVLQNNSIHPQASSGNQSNIARNQTQAPLQGLQNQNFQIQQQQSPQVQQSQVSQLPPQINQLQNTKKQISPQQHPQQAPVQNSQALNIQQQSQVQSQSQRATAAGSHAGTPQPTTSANIGRSASPNTPITSVNAAAKPNGSGIHSMNVPSANVFKTSVPSIAVSNQINVKAPAPVSANQNRPSLTGGSGISAPALTTPAIIKLPPYEMQSNRVLSKRKLSELVKTVGADEGDGETTIDGDVEELLLDLADEFVTSVTSFSCRLAKHRKSETLGVKDIQLHLEKNWNIRVPGYSSDEIRNVRKWNPSQAHVQRIQGIGISKSVDQNK